MKLIIRYKDPIPIKMRQLYERAFKVAFGDCVISWWNLKVIRIANIKNMDIEIQEDD